MKETNEDFIISSGEIILAINKKCFNIKVYDKEEKYVMGQIPHNLTGGNSDGPGYDHIPIAFLKDNYTGELSVCDSWLTDYVDEHFLWVR